MLALRWAHETNWSKQPIKAASKQTNNENDDVVEKKVGGIAVSTHDQLEKEIEQTNKGKKTKKLTSKGNKQSKKQTNNDDDDAVAKKVGGIAVSTQDQLDKAGQRLLTRGEVYCRVLETTSQFPKLLLS